MLDWALRWVIIITIPATLGLIVLAGPLLTTIFQYGEFTAHDVEMTTKSLMAYALGLSGFVMIKVFASGYFSRQDTKTPVKIGIVAMVSNIILSLLLVTPLAHAGLALATSLASFVNAGLLFYFLQKRNVFQFQKGWSLFLVRVVLACTMMSVVLMYLVPPVQIWLHWEITHRALNLAQWIIAGMFIYAAVLWLSGIRFRHMTLDS